MDPKDKLKFIDVFAGCGGISTGLSMAGWKGIFAIEKSPLAFDTLKYNLINKRTGFEWPKWLPKQAMTCEELLASYSNEVGRLEYKVDLIVGGPPCQGFSVAGKRNPADPRNKMTEQYLAMVGLIKPRFIVIENVAGYNMEFEAVKGAELLMGTSEKMSYAQYIATRLTDMGYKVSHGLVNCADFGVPQNRNRYLIICERAKPNTLMPDLMARLKSARNSFLLKRNLPTNRPVSSKEAISDLLTSKAMIVPCGDSAAPGYSQIQYRPEKALSAYQKLMRRDAGNAAPNSLRLPKHRPTTIEYFKRVQEICRPGVSLSRSERERAGTKKQSTTVLHKDLPSPTVTTLPDDILHYDEPRILTARENARLQSFPDWFEFKGKYTTGGEKRKLECPRYTQIGNAVPPLLAEAIGEVLKARIAELRSKNNIRSKKRIPTRDLE